MTAEQPWPEELREIGKLREIDQMIDDLLKISGRLNIDGLGDGEYRFGVTTRNNSLARVAPDWRDALREAYAAVVGELYAARAAVTDIEP